MLNTLNYSEAIEAFSSFVSSEPRWYIDLKGSYYSFNADGKCFLHNAGNDYNRMKDTVTPDRSFIKLLVNDDYEVTKTFDNVSYSADFSTNENIVPLQFKTRLHTTGKVEFIDSREDTYKFSVPRDASNDIPGSAIRTVANGLYYDWYAVNNPSGLAPDGWHIPSLSEFQELVEYAGGDSVAKTSLKAGDGHGWINLPGLEGTDEFGFTAEPAGIISSRFQGAGIETFFFSSTELEANPEAAHSITFLGQFVSPVTLLFHMKTLQGSIRCIKNDSTYVPKLVDIDGNEYPTVKIGNQVWMKKNLATTRYKNGDLIPPKVYESTVGSATSVGGSFTTEVIEEHKEMFSSRLRGKYMTCDYEFKSSDGNKFRLPYIETTYRYSMI